MEKYPKYHHILKIKQANDSNTQYETTLGFEFISSDEPPSYIDTEKQAIYFIFCVGHNLLNLACSKITQSVLYNGMANLIKKYPSINETGAIILPHKTIQHFFEGSSGTNLLICLTDHEDCMYINRFDLNDFIRTFNYIHSEIVKKIYEVHPWARDFSKNLIALPMTKNGTNIACPSLTLCSFSQMFINQTAETRNGFDVIKKEYDKRKLPSSNGPYHYIICYSTGYCHETSLSDVFETLYEKHQRMMEFDPSTDDKLTTQDIIDIRNNSTGFVYIVVCNANYGCIHSHNNIISKKETLIEQNARNNLLQTYDEILSSGEVLNDNCDMVMKDIIELFSIFLLCLERTYKNETIINECKKAKLNTTLFLDEGNCKQFVNRLIKKDSSRNTNLSFFILSASILPFLITVLLSIFLLRHKIVSKRGTDLRQRQQ